MFDFKLDLEFYLGSLSVLDFELDFEFLLVFGFELDSEINFESNVSTMFFLSLFLLF